MAASCDAEYYGGMGEVPMSDVDLELSKQDWMGNDQFFFDNGFDVNGFTLNPDDFFQQMDSQEAFTPSTDSGNHSPTGSHSDSSQHPHQWNIEDQQLTEILASNQPPTPVDLDALEEFLSEKYLEESYKVSPPQSTANFSPQSFDSFSFQPHGRICQPEQSIQQQQVQAIPIVPASSIRHQPYPVIRPAIKQENVQPVQLITTTAPQQIFLAQNDVKFVSAMMPTSSNTILIPANKIPLVPLSVQQEGTRAKEKEDDFTKKCEDRKLRNRHAAQLSRERKKAEMDQMKNHVSQLQMENDELKRENERLKKRIAELEYFFSPTAAKSKTNVVKAVGVSLMVICMVCTLPGALQNLTPAALESEPHARALRSLPESKSNGSDNAIAHVGSRSLLAVEDYDSGDEFARVPANNVTFSGSCPNGFLNTSERIRVNNDLIRWIDRHDQMNLVQLRAGKNPYLIYNSQKALFPKGSEPTVTTNSTDLMNVSDAVRRKEYPRRIPDSGRQKTLRERSWRHIDLINSPIGPKEKHRVGGTELAIPISVQEQIMKQLISQLKQKDDMLYVMAFKDYVILPQTGANTTESPKLSIVLPALAVNSSQPNHVTMMRIECSVTSTSLFVLPDRFVSLFNGPSN